MIARVALQIDGERTVGTLLSSPNAIGVCDVVVREHQVQRHVSKLEALDDEARRLLASGDRFVVRDPLETVNGYEPTAIRPEAWTIDHLDQMRIYVAALRVETQASRRPDRNKRIHHLGLVSMLVKRWLKEARMERTNEFARLTDEEARDPLVLLDHARRAIYTLNKEIFLVTGEHRFDEERHLADVIGNYLTHHAPAHDPRRR